MCPSPLLEKRGLPQFIGRETSLQQAYDSLLNNTGDIPNRGHIVATQGAPGTGKSDFADHLGQKMRQELPDLLVINVTYNGHTSLKSSSEPKWELATRILYSVFFDHSRNNWESFQVPLKGFSREVTLQGLLTVILQKTKAKQLMVVIDEIARSPTPVYTLHLISTALDSVRKIGVGTYLFVTSLDTQLTDSQTPGSSQPIVWIPLTAVPLDQILSTCFVAREWQHPLMRLLVRDAGGHMRTLSCLHHDSSKLFKQISFTTVYDSLLACLQLTLSGNGVLLSKADLPMLKPAILGEQVSLNDKPLDCEMTVEQLVARGIYFNAGLGDQRKFCPFIPPLQLLLWCQKETSLPSALLHSMLSTTQSLIKSMPSGQSYVGLAGEGLEHFHACWEALSRALIKHSGQNSMVWNHHYQGSRNNCQISIPTEPLLLKPKTGINTFPHFWNSLQSTSAWTPAWRLEKEPSVDQFTLPMICHLGGNFPGYDTVIFDVVNNAHGDRHVTLVQCKYSEHGSESTLTATEVLSALSHAITHWAPLVDDPKQLLPCYEDIKTEQIKRNNTKRGTTKSYPDRDSLVSVDHSSRNKDKDKDKGKGKEIQLQQAPSFIGQKVPAQNVDFVIINFRKLDSILVPFLKGYHNLEVTNCERLAQIYGPSLWTRVNPIILSQ